MFEYKTGDNVPLLEGGSVKIKKELGRGGQGIVYQVEQNGQSKALKWYFNDLGNRFYDNLKKNIKSGAPSEAFLWPEALTERQNGSFGYVMKLRPEGYYEFGNFLLAKVHFKSFTAMMAAAMKICNGFMKLHLFGYSYQDLNDGNFFINPQTGDVLICDNDNVMAQGESSGIMGKARYMAPEVVAGGIPDKYSDRFSLSVMLFMLFYAGHPFEGARVAACPCLTEAFEKRFYGSEALFVYNPNDKSNLPVKGIHTNVIRRWPVFPAALRQAFIEQFSEKMLKNPSERMIEQGWVKLLSSIRDSIVVCPHCGKETFFELDGDHKCIECGATINLQNCLRVDQRKIMLSAGSKLYIDYDNIPDAAVIADPQNKSMLLIQNLSKETWVCETRSGKIKQVSPKEYLPVLSGIKITFGSLAKGEIL